jgi:hypothetical protein
MAECFALIAKKVRRHQQNGAAYTHTEAAGA